MPHYKVGIIGAGIAGLYTALLLQREGHSVRIFEGTDRVGGRVRTHYFTPGLDQYYEAGAMRIPKSKFHEIVFSLIDYLNNDGNVPQEMNIRLIEYVLHHENNDVFINSTRSEVHVAAVTPNSLGWNVPPNFANRTAGDLLHEALNTLTERLDEDNFEESFRQLVNQFDHYTFRFYLTSVLNWPQDVIDFVETVMSQTNQFSLSVPELVMQSKDFDVQEWRTIDQGMSRLPEAMAHRVGYENITFGARVTGIENLNNRRIKVTATGYNGRLTADFDHVVLAIPPAALRMIADRPRWSERKEMAIRSIHFEPLYKMGLRFKTRFWERVRPRPTSGGQSTTDRPIRWLVFPSNGIGSQGPGVLLVYAWMTDASNWIPLTPIERRALALNCIAEMYHGRVDENGSRVDVHRLLIETSDAVWSESTATGDSMFLPGQFTSHFDVAGQPEGNIYFAGEHLSYHHTWISGAADSALTVARQILGEPRLQPLVTPDEPPDQPPAPMPSQGIARVPFVFQPTLPPATGPSQMEPTRQWPSSSSSNTGPNTPSEDSGTEYTFPHQLGVVGTGPGPMINNLQAVSVVIYQSPQNERS